MPSHPARAGRPWCHFERKAHLRVLVAAQFVEHPEPLPGLTARIYKDGRVAMQSDTYWHVESDSCKIITVTCGKIQARQCSHEIA